jgi:hypothetical protein
MPNESGRRSAPAAQREQRLRGRAVIRKEVVAGTFFGLHAPTKILDNAVIAYCRTELSGNQSTRQVSFTVRVIT